MSFLTPIYLWLLIPFVIFFIRSPQSIIIKTHVLILILLIISLARPIQKEVYQKTNILAQEVIIAIDISYSMHATDISPTRYLFAKETIKHLLSYNISDNIMLIAFTSNPLLLSPPSTDHALIGIALDNLNPEFILTKSTSLKRLFTKLHSLSQTPKTLILMTDGGEEHNTEDLSTILEKSNISLITLALGTQQGTTISKKDGSAMKDKKGNLVITRINPLLKEFTNILNGTFLTADSSPKETALKLHNILQKSTDKESIEKQQHRYKEFYQIPLFIATLLFLLLHTRAVKYIIILFTFLNVPLQASLLDNYYLHKSYQYYAHKDYSMTKHTIKKIDNRSLQSQLLLANTKYKQGDYKKALQVYMSIKSTSIPIKKQIYYNIANTYIHLHKYTKAKQYYIKVLQLGVDADAVHNLRLCMHLEDKKSAPPGIVHPKSQSSQSNKSTSQTKKSNKKRDEDQPSSSSGSGTQERSQEKKREHKLISEDKPQKQPLGSKVYELINKGYIHEIQPW